MSELEMVQAVEQTVLPDGVWDRLEKLFPALGFPEDCRDKRALLDSVVRGDYKFLTIKWNGKLLYQVFFHLTLQRHLYVNAAIALSDDHHFDVLIAGLEKYSREQNLTGIIFDTRRKGLIHQAQEFDFKIGGVVMVKML